MSATTFKPPSGGALIAIIGDEVQHWSTCFILKWRLTCELEQDTVTGFLLTGMGQRSSGKTNFLIVHPESRVNVFQRLLKHSVFFLIVETSVGEIEQAFNSFTARSDIAMVLINQHVRCRVSFYFLLSIIQVFPLGR